MRLFYSRATDSHICHTPFSYENNLVGSKCIIACPVVSTSWRPLCSLAPQGDCLSYTQAPSVVELALETGTLLDEPLWGMKNTCKWNANLFSVFFSLSPASLVLLASCVREKRMNTNMNFFFFLFFPSITRTFASGKTEKVIFQALKELGLPSGKVFISNVFLKPHCLLDLPM